MPLLPQYAPEFSVRIDGEPLPAAMRGSVASISYQDGIEGADRVEMTLANPSLRFLDDPLLAPDREFRLLIGYAGAPLEEVFNGNISGVEPSFPAAGMPVIRVTAQDELQYLQAGTKDRAFRVHIPSIGNFPVPDPIVTSMVAALDGLIPLPDPVGGPLSALITLATVFAFPQTAQLSVRRQQSQSDFQFLQEISSANGWEMYIDHEMEPRGKILRFQFVVQDYSPSLTLSWGSSLIDFTPRITTVGEIFGVAARVWVETLKTEFVIAVSWDYDRAALNLTVFPSLIGEADKVLGPTAEGKVLSVQPTGYAAAPLTILGVLLPKLNNRIKGAGTAVGNPAIRGSRVVRFEGLGSEFSGKYRIVTATHTFDNSGYRTSFQARKEVWFGSIPTPSGRP
ncbi:MAG: phage late control D family protein, partial [Bryobacteraceae bacterium]